MKSFPLHAWISGVALIAGAYPLGSMFPWASFSAPTFDELTELADTIEFVGLDDGNGNPLRTLRFSGVNLQIVNGMGATNGNAAQPSSIEPADVATNGVGNLILGYHEPPPAGGSRTGSHNLVIGIGSRYTSFGGLIAGREHALDGPFGVALGGSGNDVTGAYATIAGGRDNAASGDYSLVAGGRANTAAGSYSAAIGGGGANGEGNVAQAEGAVVLGGRSGLANAASAVVAGGDGNEATGELAVVAGGRQNRATASLASVLGGEQRTADAVLEVIADGAGVDDDWTLVGQGSDAVLLANADRVGIGTSVVDAPLAVRPPDPDEPAASFRGDVLIGGPSLPGKSGDSEHLRIRAQNGDWFLAARNAPTEAESALTLGADESDTDLFHLRPDGFLGLGTDEPEALLHLRREQWATALLEQTDDKLAGEAGLRLVQPSGVGEVGFFGRDGSLVLRIPDGEQTATGVEVSPAGEVRLVGNVTVHGEAVVAGNLTTPKALAIGEDLEVGGDAHVLGDLTVAGDLEVTGAINLPGWSQLRPIAWGHVAQDGDRLSGSSNWTSTFDAALAGYRITLDAVPSGSTNLQVTQTGASPGVFLGTETPGDVGSQLESNEYVVFFHTGWLSSVPPKFSFSFVIYAES